MDFFLSNQLDAQIIQIYSVIKLHVLGTFSAHHQEFSTVHSALVNFMQSQDGMQFRSILTLFGRGHQKPAWNLLVPNVQ